MPFWDGQTVLETARPRVCAVVHEIRHEPLERAEGSARELGELPHTKSGLFGGVGNRLVLEPVGEDVDANGLARDECRERVSEEDFSEFAVAECRGRCGRPDRDDPRAGLLQLTGLHVWAKGRSRVRDIMPAVFSELDEIHARVVAAGGNNPIDPGGRESPDL
jgi:hypothetical protein